LSKYRVSPPNKVMIIPLISGTIGILFSSKYTATSAIRVAMIKGGIAAFKSFSLLKYIVKNIRSGPKSAKNLIMGLFIGKC
tara:strand:+ start:64 stop:306 length:243 start_codon:yes stop_codon:yes gene_type:complete